MTDYPKSIMELEKQFASEEKCHEYLFNIRWPNGFRCSKCEGDKGWKMANGLIVCRGCRHQQSILAGTVFQDTHIPLQTWFRVMWHMCAQKNGMSALGLQRVLGIASYNTAWLCLHKLRRAMIRPGRERLRGRVQVDESYVGGPREGKRGRGAYGKKIVFVAVEHPKPRVLGRIRLSCIPDVKADSLIKALKENVEEGSVVITDGWISYAGIQQYGYIHEIADKEDIELPEKLLPECHLVVSLLKRWILGTHQGNIGGAHIQDYLNEFAFRFNRRTSRSRGLLFYRLVGLAAVTPPNTRSTIVPQHLVVG